MAFLQDANKLITFSANAPVQLSWSSAVSGSASYDSEFENRADDDTVPLDLKSDNNVQGFDLNRDLSLKLTTGIVVNIGKSLQNCDSHVRSVSVTLRDYDNGSSLAF
ncbi:unnamed protein product [Sphagnum jensenii]|uniref:Uncharacterized protein n=1 Tax=Sphagnum jensenii TaxID=128206 RepID=A0ABP0V8Z0_9BRYO